MQTPDWEQMPFFLAVARCGSLRAAAEELGASHATVGRHIAALETAYGVRLFRRTRKGIELTEAGVNLRPIAEQAEALFIGARRRMQGLDRQAAGVVRFSVTGTMAYSIVAPILASFSRAHPDIDLQINVTDRIESIERLQTDVSLRYAEEVRDDAVARKLYRWGLMTYASRDYIARTRPDPADKGRGLTWIGWDSTDRNPDWIRDSEFPRATARHATTDHNLQIALARHGEGMVRTAPILAEQYPELVPVPGTRLTPDRMMWILLHSDLRRTTRVRRFVDHLAAGLLEMKDQLGGFAGAR